MYCKYLLLQLLYILASKLGLDTHELLVLSSSFDETP
jgi:hypothetical protein